MDIRSGVNQSTSQTTSSSSSSGLGKIFGSGNGEGSSESSQTSLALTTIEGKGVSIQATGNAGIGGKLPGDINLTAVKINPNEAEGGKLELSAKGDLNLASITTTDYAKSESKGSSLLWQSAEGKGHVNDSVHYNQIQVDPKNINLNIGNKITADMSVKDSVAVLASQPQLAYMAKLVNDPALSNKVNWSKVQEAHDQWDYKQSGLTPAASAIVALAVAVATSGAGAKAVGLMTGTSSSTALATYGVSTAAMQAAITTLATQASVGLINNGGNLGKTMQQLGSNESMKGLVLSMITAGTLQELANTGFMQNLGGISGASTFTSQLSRNLINNSAVSVVDSALNGTSLEENLKNGIVSALINTGAAQGANAIGTAATGTLGTPAQINLFGQLVAHAILGCTVGAARTGGENSSGGCNAGAIGAVVGELSAQTLDPNATGGQNTVNIASIMSGIAVALAGGDAVQVNIASSSAANAVENNWLATAQIRQMKKEFTEANTVAEQLKVTAKWAYISGKQDTITAYGVGKGLSEAGINDIKGLAEFLSDPSKGLDGLSKLISDPSARVQLGESLYKSLNDKITNMKTSLEVGGDKNAEILGKELGSVIWQVGTVVTGVGGAAKATSQLAKIGINASMNGLENLAFNLAKLDAGAIKGFSNAEDVNKLMTSYNNLPAWKNGTQIADVTLQSGAKVQMVVDKAAYEAISSGNMNYTGNWATFENVTSQGFARNNLAITNEFKKDVGFVVELEVVKPVSAQIGVVGSQGAGAIGGANQLNFIFDRGTGGQYFKLIAKRELP